MKFKLLPTIFLILLCFVACGIFYYFYLVFEPFNPPTLAPKAIPILNPDKKIRHGETISTKLDYCVYKKVSSTTTRRIESVSEDRRVYFLSTTLSAGQDPKCGSVTNNTFPIPIDIPEGKYKVILVTEFKVNPVKQVSATYETEEFTVVDK